MARVALACYTNSDGSGLKSYHGSTKVLRSNPRQLFALLSLQ
jgi:hypothetical protein